MLNQDHCNDRQTSNGRRQVSPRSVPASLIVQSSSDGGLNQTGPNAWSGSRHPENAAPQYSFDFTQWPDFRNPELIFSIPHNFIAGNIQQKALIYQCCTTRGTFKWQNIMKTRLNSGLFSTTSARYPVRTQSSLGIRFSTLIIASGHSMPGADSGHATIREQICCSYFKTCK
jgi:hypothetical protein